MGISQLGPQDGLPLSTSQDWVTDVVLPSIHKNGGYIAGQEDMISKNELLPASLAQRRRLTADRDRANRP